MPKNDQSSMTSSPEEASEAVGTPSVVTAPQAQGFDLSAFRESEEGKALTQWALNEFSRCKTAKTKKTRQWYMNMAFNFGHQWLDTMSAGIPGAEGKFRTKAAPKYLNRKTINRVRSFVRTEQSKFLSTLPTVSAVPATSEEEDVRAAYAAEQVWQSYSSKRTLRREYSKATWWKSSSNEMVKR